MATQTNIITSPQQIEDFINTNSEGGKVEVRSKHNKIYYSLTADISLTLVKDNILTAFDLSNSVFNGNYHTIFLQNATDGLFYTNNTKIKKLNIRSDCDYTLVAADQELFKIKRCKIESNNNNALRQLTGDDCKNFKIYHCKVY